MAASPQGMRSVFVFALVNWRRSLPLPLCTLSSGIYSVGMAWRCTFDAPLAELSTMRVHAFRHRHIHTCLLTSMFASSCLPCRSFNYAVCLHHTSAG